VSTRNRSKSRLRAAWLALPLALVATPAAAQPSAPAGWSADRRGSATVYAPKGRRDVELRLHSAATAKRALADWFAARLSTAPAGVDFAGYASNQELKDGAVRMAYGAGKMRGAQVVVVALACQKPDASKVYGELISPPDEDTLRRYTTAATELVLNECFTDGGSAAPQPAAEPAEKAAPAARKKPEFRYIARKGRGVSRSQIEGVLTSWEQIYETTGLHIYENAYLLLKNGRARRLPPVPPEDFDAAAEMAAEPQEWGTWKKKGGDYLIKFADYKDFRTPPGQDIADPAPANHRLDGLYSTGSSSSVGPDSVMWSLSYLRFSPGNRFSHSKTGGVGGTSGDTTAVSRWDDEGSATSVTGPNIGGGGSRRSGSKTADREGTYRIDGYTLELRYDSGRVERRFFFLMSERMIWFGGGSYVREKKK
jgi:hypothetical protein